MTPDEVVEPELGPRHVSPGMHRPVVLGIALALLLVPMYLLAAGTVCADGRCDPVATPDVESPVDGIVTSVDASGLTDVRGFVLRPPGSPFSFDFVLGDLENATGFPPSHLAEHQATSSPVRVYFRLEGGERVVYRLEDAPAATGS